LRRAGAGPGDNHRYAAALLRSSNPVRDLMWVADPEERSFRPVRDEIPQAALEVIATFASRRS